MRAKLGEDFPSGLPKNSSPATVLSEFHVHLQEMYNCHDIETSEVPNRIPATIFRPKGPVLGSVLLLHGSEGQRMEGSAKRLARLGFVAAAISYFGRGSIRKKLIKIPLESVFEIIEELHGVCGFNKDNLALRGVSKGAELALVLASKRAIFRSVVGFIAVLRSVEWVGFRFH